MSSVNQKEYFRHGPHLALYHQAGGGKDYWEAQWQLTSLQDLYKLANRGDLGQFEGSFTKYLPFGKPILEAGCGNGRYVAALRARGYQVDGIDYASATIQRILAVDATMPVRVGDICSIDRPNGFYAAYISIGVLEHNFDGPEAGLIEAYRVLESGGIGLISVPYKNWPRQRLWQRSSVATAAKLTNDLLFYQDHVDIPMFGNQLKRAGFEIVEIDPFLLYGGLIRDWQLGQWLDQRNFFSWRLKQVVKQICRMAPRFIRYPLSHMMLFVVRKN